MVTQQSQLLLRLLKVRVIVDGTTIYYLETNKPVVIPIEKNNTQIVITDGFHHSKPVQLVYHQAKTYYFNVVCAIDDNQLAAGMLLLVLFFFVGLTSDILLLQLASFVPIFYFLFLYYFNRKLFLQIKPA